MWRGLGGVRTFRARRPARRSIGNAIKLHKHHPARLFNWRRLCAPSHAPRRRLISFPVCSSHANRIGEEFRGWFLSHSGRASACSEGNGRKAMSCVYVCPYYRPRPTERELRLNVFLEVRAARKTEWIAVVSLFKNKLTALNNKYSTLTPMGYG